MSEKNKRLSRRDGVPLIRKLTLTAVMTAVATVLQLVEFPIPFLIPDFIKMDFSEFPAVIIAFVFGGGWGTAVCFLKNLVKALFFSNTAMVGELANFILGAAFVFPAGAIYSRFRTMKGAVAGAAVGAAAGAIASFPVNLFITYPFYISVIKLPVEVIIGAYSAILPGVTTLPQALLVFNVPFTLVKFSVSVLLTFLIYKKISPVFKYGLSKRR